MNSMRKSGRIILCHQIATTNKNIFQILVNDELLKCQYFFSFVLLLVVQ